MIVGFSKHSTGRGYGPLHYMLDESREGREGAPPVLLRGNPTLTRQIIDSLSFKHKYSSGVLSFAPNEVITPGMEQAIMDEFEQLAFAGLEHEQYDIVWVRHTHAGHHEMHFVTPRVELTTGKSMNVKPPGKLAREHFDDFRSEINARYGLADPTDPDRARTVSTPEHELKIAAKALRDGLEPSDNVRVILDSVLRQRAVYGLIRSRDDVLANIKDLGFEIPRAGKNYVTVFDANSGQKFRLKGEIYGEEFKLSGELKETERERPRDYSARDPDAERMYAERVRKHISARTAYNQSRYPKAEPSDSVEHTQKQEDLVAMLNQSRSLSDFMARGLGSDALLLKPNCDTTASARASEREGQQDPDGLLRRASALYQDGQEFREIQQQPQRCVDGTRGVLTDDDRTRDEAYRFCEELKQRLYRTIKSISDAAKEFAGDVRNYIERKQEAAGHVHGIEQARMGLIEANRRLENVKVMQQSHVQKKYRAGPDLDRDLDG